MRRHEIPEEQWERIKDLLPGKKGDPGVTAQDNRLFLNAVLWIGRTGAPWPDLPDDFVRAVEHAVAADPSSGFESLGSLEDAVVPGTSSPDRPRNPEGTTNIACPH